MLGASTLELKQHTQGVYKMSFQTLKSITFSLILIALAVSAQAQNKRKGETIVTKPKLVVTKLKISEGESFDVRGKATFTITAANSDGSLVGTVTYTLPDDARQKISQLIGKPVAQVPATISQTEVLVELQKLTECPVVHLDIVKPMDLMVESAKIHFNKFSVDINDEGKEMNILVCTLAKQINVARPFRGVIRRMNEVINGLDPQ